MDVSFILLEWYFNNAKKRKEVNVNKNADLELFESNIPIMFNTSNAKVCKIGIKLPYNYNGKERRCIYSGDQMLILDRERPHAGAVLGIAYYSIEKDSPCFYVETNNGTLNLNDDRFLFYPNESYNTLYNRMKIGDIIVRI